MDALKDILGDAQAYRLAKAFAVMRRGAALIDQEVAVFFRYQRAADFQSATSGGVNLLPGLAAWWVGKGAATGAHAAWLCVAAAGNDVLHPGLDGGGLALRRAELGMSENPVGWRLAVAIAHAHLIRCRSEGTACPVKTVRANDNVAEFTAIGTGVHPQPTADGTGTFGVAAPGSASRNHAHSRRAASTPPPPPPTLRPIARAIAACASCCATANALIASRTYGVYVSRNNRALILSILDVAATCAFRFSSSTSATSIFF